MNGQLGVSQEVRANRLEQDREGVVQALRSRIDSIAQQLEHSRSEIEASNVRLQEEVPMLGNVYGPATGESFSKRGKTDIYLPWDGGSAVFLAECKWWTGPKAFAEDALPQLLDRYVVWRDTHAAMVLFIRNRNASAVIEKAEEIIRAHPRFLRDVDSVGDMRAFTLHKDGDIDREIKLALITAVIHA